MALSDREQQLLEQMERALASEDPLLAAVSLSIPALGVVGFLAIVSGFYFANLGAKSSPAAGKPGTASKTSTSGGFMQGLEDRWDRRQDNG